MSSRQAEKQRRRAEREASERRLAARERRARRLRVTAAVMAAGAILAGGVALATLGNGAGSNELPAESSQPFGQHYDGLEQRRVAAGVSTMAAPSANEHTHPHLSVWVNGGRVTVPANIGIDPREDPGQMASLYTRDDSGTIHNEGQADATLGQFFAVWGVPFSQSRLGPYRAGDRRVVKMWVDGESSQAWARCGPRTARTSTSPSVKSAPPHEPPEPARGAASARSRSGGVVRDLHARTRQRPAPTAATRS